MSAIVRTIGRDTLGRTLESLDRQTWRPLELVLVQAREEPLQPFPLSIPVRRAGGRALERPHALNVGLEAATGEWLMFLDEDDSLEPDHVESLVQAAIASGTRVTYSQTRLVDAHGATQRIFGGPYHRELLLRSNYLSINAVLFHRSFVDQGLRVDESFLTLEDWDFWLQLSQIVDFTFVARPTAIYHGDSGGSGAGAGPNLDREAVLRQRNRLMRKWGRA